MMTKHILILLITSALCACTINTSTGYKQMCESWIGAPEIALIQAWGTPIRTYQIEDIKYITFSESYIVSGYSNSSIHSSWCETTFAILNHRVINYNFEGNRCLYAEEESPNYVPQSVTSIMVGRK